MKNGDVVTSVWENNREDGEDSATQVRGESQDINVTFEVQLDHVIFLTSKFVCSQAILLEMKSGDQVYMELTSGRKLCNYLQFNSFSGHIVYPEMDD